MEMNLYISAISMRFSTKLKKNSHSVEQKMKEKLNYSELKNLLRQKNEF